MATGRGMKPSSLMNIFTFWKNIPRLRSLLLQGEWLETVFGGAFGWRVPCQRGVVHVYVAIPSPHRMLATAWHVFEVNHEIYP